jgi:hypothetical protein
MKITNMDTIYHNAQLIIIAAASGEAIIRVGLMLIGSAKRGGAATRLWGKSRSRTRQAH